MSLSSRPASTTQSAEDCLSSGMPPVTSNASKINFLGREAEQQPPNQPQQPQHGTRNEGSTRQCFVPWPQGGNKQQRAARMRRTESMSTKQSHRPMGSRTLVWSHEQQPTACNTQQNELLRALPTDRRRRARGTREDAKDSSNVWPAISPDVFTCPLTRQPCSSSRRDLPRPQSSWPLSSRGRSRCSA